jgi:Polysaccharide biosynthesis enzyme WcbI
MRALVVSNCVTATYVQCLQALFPEWEVRGAGIDESTRWLKDGQKKDFELYAANCDLYFGWSPAQHAIESILNPKADRIVVPGVHFRGLHPDVAYLPDFRGPFSVAHDDTQVSLIAAAGKALGCNISQTISLFAEATYEALGFLSGYASERQHLLEMFRHAKIDITEELATWELQGAYFYICHHPKVFVLVDIVRRALAGRYLTKQELDKSASLRQSQRDNLAWSETWPVYPEVARLLGFSGGLTWKFPESFQPREKDLSEYIAMTFTCLEKYPRQLDEIPSVKSAAMAISKLKSRGTQNSPP